MKKDSVIKEFLDDIKKDKNKKVPQEALSNSMVISSEPFSVFWRPNNYRRQIVLNNPLNSGSKTTIASTTKGRIANHTKLLYIKNYMPNITLMIGKEKITAIWSQNIINNVKEVFLIKSDSINGLETRIQEKKQEIEFCLEEALLTFLEQFGLKSDFKPVWTRHEDFIKGDDYIDSIPREVIVHDTVFKKVYEKGVELMGGSGVDPTVRMKNYIKNRAIEDISPAIAKELNDIKHVIKVNQGSIKTWCEENLGSIQDVLNHEAIIRELSEANRLLVSEFLFDNFNNFETVFLDIDFEKSKGNVEVDFR